MHRKAPVFNNSRPFNPVFSRQIPYSFVFFVLVVFNSLNAKQLQLVELLTIENAVFIKLGMNYTDRKSRLLETALHFERKGN